MNFQEEFYKPVLIYWILWVSEKHEEKQKKVKKGPLDVT